MQLFVRWFVQYNPFFTLSALSVIGGVLLLSRAFGDDAEVALTGVLELYQWLVIGTAGLLYRRLCDHRPGVILGVIALVFLVDPTLQLGALAATGAFFASALWVASFALKWRALLACFQLEVSTSGRVLPPLAAAFVAVLPNARVLGVLDKVLVPSLAVGVFLLLLAGVAFPPAIRSKRALGEVGQVMFPRLLRAAVGVGVAGVLYQAWNAALAIGPSAVLAAVAAVALVGVAVAARERTLWGLFGLALVLAVAPHGAAKFVLGLAGVALLFAARRHAPRVFVAGVSTLVVAAALPTLEAGGTAQPPWTLVVLVGLATAALVHALVRRRAWSALPALGVLYARPLEELGARIAPVGEGPWGAVLVVAGFVLLPLGVWGHRRVSRWLEEGQLTIDGAAPTASAADAPSTSAAIGAAL